MRIAYFHGWGGHFNDAKYKILSKFGDEVYFPDIDYTNHRNLISSYANELFGSNNPTLIVGTSLGGYLGFHISNIVRCPALLINPAFFSKSGGELKPNSNSTNNDDYQKQFIFSVKDEEVDVKRCIKMLKDFKYEDAQIKLYPDLTHQIPIDVFENEFSEFREKFKDFKGFEQDKPKKSSKNPYAEAKLKVSQRYDTVGYDTREIEDMGDQVIEEPVEVSREMPPDEPNWWDTREAINTTSTRG